MAFRPDIEGLRGVAILIGVLYHLDFPIPGGIAGMDIFFPMSGFLITTLLAIEFQRNRIDAKKRSHADTVFPKADGGTTAVSSSGSKAERHQGHTGSSRTTAAGTISLSAFFGRRIRRLMPAALATIAVVLVVSKLLFNEIRFAEVQGDAFWSTFWLENFHLISQSTDYFAAGLDKSPLQHFWSLAVEEQFYLFWPVTLLLVAKAKFLARLPFCSTWQSRILTATVAFGLPSLAWSYLYTNSNPAGSYFSTFTRAWDLLLGASIALLPAFRAGLSPTLSKVMSWLGVAFLTVALVIIGTDTAYPGLIALIPTLGTCMLLIAGVNSEAKTPVYRFLASGPIRWTGKVSYSLYLWHWPIIIFAAAIVPKSEFGGLPRGTLLFILSLLAAWASYSLIEAPFMDVKKFKAQHYDRAKKVWHGTAKANAKAAAMASAAALTLIAIAAFARPGGGDVFSPPQALEAYANGSALKSLTATSGESPVGDGAGQSTPDKASGHIFRAWGADVLRAVMNKTATPAEVKLAEQTTKLAPSPDCYEVAALDKAKRCSLSGQAHEAISWPAGLPKRVILMGHSIAAQFRETIANVLPRDVTIEPLTKPACQLSAGSADEKPDCVSHNAWAFSAAKKLKPGLLVFSVILPDDAQKPDMQALGQRIRSLAPHSLFIVDAPTVPSFADCLDGNRVSACMQPKSTNVLVNLANSRQFARQFGMTEFSLTSLLCAESQCPPFINGQPVRFDGQHLTVPMMRLLEPFLASTINLALNSPS